MRIGWYEPGGLARAPLVAAAGYDYIELGLAPMKLEEANARAEARRAVAASPVPALAWNNFFPRDMRVVDPGVDVTRLQRYFAKASEFLHAVGARVVVMGSAWARNVPAGGDFVRAEAQLVQALSWAADAFAGSGVTIAFEAQCHLECNLVRRVSEAVCLVRKVDRPEVRALADFYHMQMEGEPLEVLSEAGPWLAHVQLADTHRRNPGTGGYPYDAFMQRLREGGYRGDASVECMNELPQEEMRRSLRFLREKTASFG